VSGIILAIVSSWAKSYFEQREMKKKVNSMTSEKFLGAMIKVQNWLDGIREFYDFDRISICQFHNGGEFQNGTPMSKFSITYESVSPGISTIKNDFKNVFTSEYPKWVSAMLRKKIIIKCPETTENTKTKEQLEKYGILKSVTIPIKDINNCLVGFIWIHWVKNHDKFQEIEFEKLCNSLAEIKGYLDMNK